MFQKVLAVSYLAGLKIKTERRSSENKRIKIIKICRENKREWENKDMLGS